MGKGAPLTFRTPLALLAVLNLFIVGMRLRPWQEIATLPGNGTTGYDPVICLVAYVVLLFWVGGMRGKGIQSALSEGLKMGLLTGALLVGVVLIDNHPGVRIYTEIQLGLLATAIILWGIAGIRGAAPSGNATIGIVSGAWGSMTAGLMACTVVLAKIDLKNPDPITTDPWKQYQGLAIGNQSIQSLVHSLNTATAFLLIGPLVGLMVGLMFALVAQRD